MSTPPVPWRRAKEIAEGLMRTGRGSDVRLVGTWLQLRATTGNFYWISLNGAILLRGDTVDGRARASAEVRGRYGARRVDEVIGRGRPVVPVVVPAGRAARSTQPPRATLHRLPARLGAVC
jgi:hypothetical protein